MYLDESYLPYHLLAEILAKTLPDLVRPLPAAVRAAAAPAAPKVSVVMATYNRSNVLHYALQSVLWQTFRDFEVLVVGDHCTDDSERVAAAWNDPRIRWHNLPENSKNQSKPNTVGIQMARAPFIAYLNHDDLWHPRHLETLLDAQASESADVVWSRVLNLGALGSGVMQVWGIFSSGAYEYGRGLVGSCLLHRREPALRIGGWRDYRTIVRAPNCDFVCRLYDAGCRFAPSGELTLFKFMSTMARNLYVEKPCREQADLVQRLSTDRACMLRLALDLFRIHHRRLPMDIPKMPDPPDSETKGWLVTQLRIFRGLEP